MDSLENAYNWSIWNAGYKKINFFDIELLNCRINRIITIIVVPKLM